MIDIHSHLLFGVDDGCETIEDSIELIQKAKEEGFTDLILTPHYSFRRNYTTPYHIVEQTFNLLVEAVNNKGIKIRLFLGSEIDESKSIFDFLKNNVSHTLNNSNYVLVDFGEKMTDVDDICYELKLRGYKPIIAHPERYLYVKGIDTIKKWKDTGALIQINASSLYSDSETRKKAQEFIKHNLVDYIATDVHRSKKSYDHYSKALKYLYKKLGNEAVENITRKNALDIIN